MAFYVESVMPRSGGSIYSSSGSGSLPAGGSNIFNIESTFGTVATGLLMVRGNENNINGTFYMWSWNISIYLPTSERYINLNQITDAGSVMNNNYGQVYAYLGAYSADRANTYQQASAANSSVSDIYFRNAAGAGCTYQYTVWRTG